MLSEEHPQHRVYFVKYRDGLECDACDRSYGDAYSCVECRFTVHKKCLFFFTINKILDHPSHDGHRLELLTAGAPDYTEPKCHHCGKNTKRLLYHCFDCNLNLDMDCIVDYLCARSDQNVMWHAHPLQIVELCRTTDCEVCGHPWHKSYFCPRCRLMVHEKCVHAFDSQEITHPSHGRHSLKLLTEGAPSYTDRNCHLCGKDPGMIIYHCDICKFNLDLNCAIRKPPPLAFSDLKVHEHTLALMPRLISFVCDACGTKGDRAPYVCVQCDFMIFHHKCAQLPRVIHVNHHDHRVSYKYPIGRGEWRCGVCWEEIDWSYGAYTCSLCLNYAIHSRCATRRDVWDGKDLDGEPEEVEDITPFKMNDDQTITHFGHEHNLSLNKDGEESSLCGVCVLPIGSYTFYKCSKSYCSFILHETCANLLKKKRHFLSPQRLHLVQVSNYGANVCDACQQVYCEGFMYSNKYRYFDVLCCSIDVPFIHGSHPHHPLLYLNLKYYQFKTCQGCGMNHIGGVVIGCVKCNYFLDFRCATLPLTVRLPIYDDHPLALCYGEKASGKYWCDICERELNSETWFYTCEDCRVTLHIFCVLGGVKNAKPGGTIHKDVKLLPNNRSTRPICYNCHFRCPGPYIIKDYAKVVFFCSWYCYAKDFGMFYSNEEAMCPPWAKRS